MEFIRRIINSDELAALLPIPDELKHQNVELIILPLNEKKNGTKRFNPQDFEGSLSIEDEKLSQMINDIRGEWDRH